jgi:hypothetical protein
MAQRTRITGMTRYGQIIEGVFLAKYQEGMRKITFKREDLVHCAEEHGIKLPSNIGDILYSFRYRTELPQALRRRAPEGETWIIRSIGRGRYQFELVPNREIAPSSMVMETKIPDATPGVVAMYALTDEQSLLARLRYNRLIDVFTGVTCYSLQSHLRTHVNGVGQVETDEIYVGMDSRGVHYAFPVQAKRAKDRLSFVQIEHDLAMCAAKFPTLVCRPIGAQFTEHNAIALFEFRKSEEKGIEVVAEKHYRLVAPDQLSPSDLAMYGHASVSECDGG